MSATASIATTTAETVTTNNVATALTLVGSQPPDLSISLAVSPTLLSAGSNTVMVTVTHVSGMATTGTVVVTMPNLTTVGFTIASLLSPGQVATFSANYSLPLLTSASQTFSAVVTPSAAADSNPPNNTTTLLATVGAKLDGLAWIDSNRNRTFQAGEAILPNLLVRLYNSSSVVVGTAFTGTDGRYTIKGVPPGTGYRVEFANCVTPSDQSTCTAISTTPYNQAANTQGGNPSTGVTTVTSTTSGATVGQAITGVTLYVGDNTVDQNLPLDPRGQVYDSVTRQPIANVLVRLNGPAGFVPATHLIDLNGAGQVNNESTTDVNGLYQFIFINNPPPGVYTLNIVTVPAAYLATPATLGGVTQPNIIGNVLTTPFVVPSAATNMQPGYAAPGTPPAGVVGSSAVGVAGTQYAMTMSFAFGGGYIGELFNNNIPLDAIASGGGGGGTGTFDLSITKNGPAVAASGVTATYTLQITNPGPTSAANVTVTDVMPAGLSLISATVQPANALALSVTPAGLVATNAEPGSGRHQHHARGPDNGLCGRRHHQRGQRGDYHHGNQRHEQHRVVHDAHRGHGPFAGQAGPGHSGCGQHGQLCADHQQQRPDHSGQCDCDGRDARRPDAGVGIGCIRQLHTDYLGRCTDSSGAHDGGGLSCHCAHGGRG